MASSSDKTEISATSVSKERIFGGASTATIMLTGYSSKSARVFHFRTAMKISADNPIFHDDEKGAKIKQRKKKKEERKAMKNATYTTVGVTEEYDMEKVLSDLGELEVVKGKGSKTKSNRTQKSEK